MKLTVKVWTSWQFVNWYIIFFSFCACKVTLLTLYVVTMWLSCVNHTPISCSRSIKFYLIIVKFKAMSNELCRKVTRTLLAFYQVTKRHQKQRDFEIEKRNGNIRRVSDVKKINGILSLLQLHFLILVTQICIQSVLHLFVLPFLSIHIIQVHETFANKIIERNYFFT